MNREFGEFNGGTFTLGVLGYDFAPKLGVKEALLTGNYVYQNPDPRQHVHAAARAHRLDQLPVRGHEVGRARGSVDGRRATSGRATCGRFRGCRSST